MVAHTVQDRAPATTAASLRTGLGWLRKGCSSFRCILPANSTNPSVAEKDSCKLKLAMAYGFCISNSANAANSELSVFASRFVRNAPAAIKYITAARMTDGDAPAIGTNSKISGTDR